MSAILGGTKKFVKIGSMSGTLGGTKNCVKIGSMSTTLGGTKKLVKIGTMSGAQGSTKSKEHLEYIQNKNWQKVYNWDTWQDKKLWEI